MRVAGLTRSAPRCIERERERERERGREGERARERGIRLSKLDKLAILRCSIGATFETALSANRGGVCFHQTSRQGVIDFELRQLSFDCVHRADICAASRRSRRSLQIYRVRCFSTFTRACDHFNYSYAQRTRLHSLREGAAANRVPRSTEIETPLTSRNVIYIYMCVHCEESRIRSRGISLWSLSIRAPLSKGEASG